ncbi:type II toxin-antitoxin system RelE/ParE family toxin [Nitrospirillum sp. BR 11828]|uniref:type II toxin-antitoxin system RelE/ParE family toxin n=1 Tax=Nitrospirillum sp. BR 11828 TaxID=3104325 RepID=UPI003A0FD5AE
MRLSDLLADLPENLSSRATEDLLRILRESWREWGIHTAFQTRNRLFARCHSIAAGTALGHSRQDMTSRRSRLFLNEGPFVIVYNPVTRRVLRVLHGARDFPRLLR